MERLIDRAADEMGINRLTLRKRNFIKPAQMPFAASSGVTYDSGDFQGVFNKALEISDHANFAKRKKESRKRGKLRGIAVGSYLEVTAPPGVELGKIVFEDDGSVRLITGTLDYGQGHATPFAQVLCAAARRALRKRQARTGRQRHRAYRQRHRRLALHHRERHGDRRSLEAGHREGQARRRASDGSRRRRHRIRQWPLHHRRHRSLHRHHRTGAPPARRQDAGGRALVARRRPHHRGGAVDLPQRLPRRGSRDRSRNRDRADRPLYRRQRLRHHRQSDAGRRTDCMAASRRASDRR